jgi:hypothetical protein
MKKVLFLLIFLLFLSCKETEFSAGIENRLTATIDMSPETNYNNVDFTSDDDLGGLCADHDMVFIDKQDDGSLNNEYYTIRIEAKDYFKSENNCNQYGWYTTEQENVRHQLVINAYAEEISSYMYLSSSRYIDHPNMSTSGITAYYKLETSIEGLDNNGAGVEYFGNDVEIEIVNLDLESGLMSGTLNATLFRATPVLDPSGYLGVDNLPNLDLYNPLLNDYVSDSDGDGFSDYHLTDSIRIENCVFQRITVINNVP